MTSKTTPFKCNSAPQITSGPTLTFTGGQSTPSPLQPPPSISVRFVFENCVRVTYLPTGKRQNPTTHSTNFDNQSPTPLQGYDRDEVLKSLPIVDAEVADTSTTMSSKSLKVKMSIDPESSHFSLKFFRASDSSLITSDYPTSAYTSTGSSVTHTQTLNPAKEFHVGLGDSPGRINRTSTKVFIKNVDAMGYTCSPEGSGKPLYKQWPIYSCYNAETETFYMIYYDTGSRGSVDLGYENSAFKGISKRVEFECGDLEYYFITGNSFAELNNTLAKIFGRPGCPTYRSVVGYNASSMMYADCDNIVNTLKEFNDKAKSYDIPVDGFYLSSGYTTHNQVRCVFNWDLEKVGGRPEQVFENNKGVIANVKPWLLECHPLFEELKSKGGFVKDANGEPVFEQCWSGGPNTSLPGCMVDFTTTAGYDFWVGKAREQLVNYGCTAIWVDNNEYECDGSGICGDGENKIPIGFIRPSQTLLMAQASLEALGGVEDKLVVTRAGGPGIQRYAGLTWTGDNRTSWSSLQWNTAQHSSLGVSGFPGVASDVGGFAGPRPDKELFIRWCQSALFTARFTIHSWNDDGTITEAWSYDDETVSIIRQIISVRRKFGPTFFALFKSASGEGGKDAERVLGGTGVPVTRPLMYHFPSDPNCLADTPEDDFDPSEQDVHLKDVASCDFLLGKNLLVCPIYKKGCIGRSVYLPQTSCGPNSRPTPWVEYSDTLSRMLKHLSVNTKSGPHIACGIHDYLPPLFVLGNSGLCYAGEDGSATVAMFVTDKLKPAEAMGWYPKFGWLLVKYDACKPNEPDFEAYAEEKVNVTVHFFRCMDEAVVPPILQYDTIEVHAEIKEFK
ncbi:hypothetical protein TrVE_jg13455 [Triparma verrucosa]|uniref:Glycoside hydrolase family 31 N-terminal domain-containing protein n=1 Tax=Triparma verrucosa TaxID=1606542 RepID=A0A9W7FD06_9STRA|nr:hypothetical protein TrVE_jg13455 [Triparma verrucosa]